MQTLQRTADGYQTDKVVITQQNLSPRQAQFSALAIGHTLPYKKVGAEMGITEGSVKQLAQHLFDKIGANNLLQASVELHRRGIIKILSVTLFIGITGMPQADASELYRRPPRQHRTSRIKRGSRSAWDELLNQLQPR